MKEIENSIMDFSKNLLVTIFAIFAFTSGPLLSSSFVGVKIIFIMALVSSVAGMSYGFNTMILKVNHYKNLYKNKQHKGNQFPEEYYRKMRKYIQRQYYYSVISLTLLIISVCVFCFAENFQTIKIMNITSQ